jgi:hypothetical protein
VRRSPSNEDLAIVARALGSLQERCFLTGGASIPLYLDDPLAEPPRVTYDIDVVIEVTSGVEFRERIEGQLRAQGFKNDMTPGAPVCRWRLGSLLVDVMPIGEAVLGFSNPWYEAGLPYLVSARVSDSCTWKILGVPFALASKFAAFWERGAADPRMSHDLEDILTVVGGCKDVMNEVLEAPADCRAYLEMCFSRLIREERFSDAVEGHIMPGLLRRNDWWQFW